MTSQDAGCLITTKHDMLNELTVSRDQGSSLGIWSSMLGQGMLLCTVIEIQTDEDEEDVIIMLKESNFAAIKPETHVIYLSEIDRIFSFKASSSMRF